MGNNLVLNGLSIVPAPFRKHGPDHKYIDDRTFSQLALPPSCLCLTRCHGRADVAANWPIVRASCIVKMNAYMLSNEMTKIVLDTNVFVSAMLKADTAPRRALRLCFLGEVTPLMGNALFSEFEALLGRKGLFEKAPLTVEERYQLFSDFLSTCKWVNVYYLWRPNLKDESDNHLVELAVAGGADYIVTNNKRDFKGAELNFPQMKIVSAGEFLEERKS